MKKGILESVIEFTSIISFVVIAVMVGTGFNFQIPQVSGDTILFLMVLGPAVGLFLGLLVRPSAAR